MERAGDDFRNARGVVDLCGPFGRLTEDGAVVHLLEGLAIAHAALDLPDEHDQRGGILLCDVYPGQRVGGARATGDHANAGFAGELALGIGHHGRAAFLPADSHFDVHVDKRVEHRKEAFTGNAENVPHAVRHKLADEDLPARAGEIRRGNVCHVVCGHCVIGQTTIISWREARACYSLKPGGSLRSVAGVRESLIGEARPR